MDTSQWLHYQGQSKKRRYNMNIQECSEIAESWESWCGETQWSKKLREFGELGGKIEYFCGVPQSASAIPLCFVLIMPDNSKFGSSRLKDIRNAIKIIKAEV